MAEGTGCGKWKRREKMSEDKEDFLKLGEMSRRLFDGTLMNTTGVEFDRSEKSMRLFFRQHRASTAALTGAKTPARTTIQSIL
jgi:hypothetical protein